MLATLFMAAQIAVVSHRGEHLAHPENTLPAFEAAIDAGADFFELDVRTTSDGRLVLIHDGTVNRTTGGTGKVRELTFDQIRALDAGAKFDPRFTDTKVPTFEEGLNLAHGKIGVYVDCKELSPVDLVASLKKADMLKNVVIYGDPGFLKGVLALEPSLAAMPEAGNAARLEKLAVDLNLRVAAFDKGDFKDDVIAVAKRLKLKIYVDRLWDADKPEFWQDAVDRGADGIQTDHPAALVEYLRAHGLHK
ncbi:MAG TPA: glycerophosphodiester phosphodiesterase family protein [Bryobacteraceae bacterium]|nr:glycerophosphodiester phosphodiesterase family protein [Bryobacteraceae bacterium]